MVQRAKKFEFFTPTREVLVALSAFVCTVACASTAPTSSAAAVPPSGTADAPASRDESLSRGGASLFVVHMMSDFDAFKKYFDDGEAARAKAGIKGHLLSRLDDGRAVVH